MCELSMFLPVAWVLPGWGLSLGEGSPGLGVAPRGAAFFLSNVSAS